MKSRPGDIRVKDSKPIVQPVSLAIICKLKTIFQTAERIVERHQNDAVPFRMQIGPGAPALSVPPDIFEQYSRDFHGGGQKHVEVPWNGGTGFGAALQTGNKANGLSEVLFNGVYVFTKLQNRRFIADVPGKLERNKELPRHRSEPISHGVNVLPIGFGKSVIPVRGISIRARHPLFIAASPGSGYTISYRRILHQENGYPPLSRRTSCPAVS